MSHAHDDPCFDRAQIQGAQQEMMQAGVRRLVVISGENHWCWQQAARFSQSASSWLWISANPRLIPDDATVIKPAAARTLLGQEQSHAVFDATQGFDVVALAVLAGTLRAGGWLLLLVPEWQRWSRQPDEDSVRWSDQQQAIATPHFIQHFQQQLIADTEVIIWRQGNALDLPLLTPRPHWQPPTDSVTTISTATGSATTNSPTTEQAAILQQLVTARTGVWVVTAARGRGKSALAGMLAAAHPGRCWVTGPSRAAAATLYHYAGHPPPPFFAPDALLQHCRAAGRSDEVDWLLIDEAAAIPTPLLSELLDYFPRVLLTTTVQGYEGSGRGFLLKFCASLPRWHHYTLIQPIRWAIDDPLERVIDQSLLLQEDGCLAHQRADPDEKQNWPIIQYQQAQLCSQPQQLRQFYGLLTSAHYRTSPLDLRRLMDAPGMSFSAIQAAQGLIAALWLVEEGGLDGELARQIWAGRRRPRGNLLVQSLAAHASPWWAPTLRSQRISRIAVLSAWRRCGMARRLIAQQLLLARQRGLDFLSVSFGYTESLWQFWHQCGFRLVRIGSYREASSGCYAAMMIMPLNEAGEQLYQHAHQRLVRDWPWLRQIIPLNLALPDAADQRLDEEDWRELAGFAFAHRPLEASLPALQRLLRQTAITSAIEQENTLSALCHCLQQQSTLAESVQHFNLSGRKTLLLRWRQETQQALNILDKERYEYWRNIGAF